MASSGFAGLKNVNQILKSKDAEGNVFEKELDKIGWRGRSKVGSQKMHCYFELHIEQGPILEDGNIDIGVVTHGQGLKWLEVNRSLRTTYWNNSKNVRRAVGDGKKL